jgi:hypothetical protein
VSETTSELAVHLAATEHQANPTALVDSAAFMAGVEALGPDTPGFIARVSEAVGKAVAADRERFGTEPAPAAAAPETPQVPLSREDLMARIARRRVELTPDYDGPISEADVQLAAPAVVNAWATSGRLAHLGVAAKQRRGR